MTTPTPANDNRRSTRELALEMAETIERMQAAGYTEQQIVAWIHDAARRVVSSQRA